MLNSLLGDYMARRFLKMHNHGRRMLLYVMGFLVAMIVFSQFWALPSGEEASPRNLVTDGSSNAVEGVVNNTSNIGEEGKDSGLALLNERIKIHVNSSKGLLPMRGADQLIALSDNNAITDNVRNAHDMDLSTSSLTRFDSMETLDIRIIGISASNGSSQEREVEQNQFMKSEAESRDVSSVIENYVRKMRGATITLSEMKNMSLHASAFSTSVRRRGSTVRDRQLLSASLQIKNAPVLRSISDVHAPLYRNVSVFKRSYELMERILKIYVYKEGEKPIFHHPRRRGLYAAEGWFMKLLESSKHFTVRDPRKAHLYYLPFSIEKLRTTLYNEKSRSIKKLEQYIADYLDLIKTRYRFWNRTGGADHFFVACHDWGSRITRHHLSSCIRGLCNANVARGFSIGKDVSVPVTYVRSRYYPTGKMGGKPAWERNILAFFAGQSHGYLRPLLLQYWENEFPDMKIMGPMQRDIQGKAVYREYMKSSKYCICARGYEVHTPRVVESIFYECIPVILSDNYVPPFFEVLDWEAFAVFVQEKDIPNLRNILLSIPEERYLGMQQRLKIVRKHFIWHEIPEKYDLFHMILHSVWHNRVSQIRLA